MDGAVDHSHLDLPVTSSKTPCGFIMNRGGNQPGFLTRAPEILAPHVFLITVAIFLET